VTVIVPGDSPDVVYFATPSASVPLPIAPFWSLNVTVPPVGVAPPSDRSETVAVKVIDALEVDHKGSARFRKIVIEELAPSPMSGRPASAPDVEVDEDLEEETAAQAVDSQPPGEPKRVKTDGRGDRAPARKRP
jgi:hypothetical protein